MLPSPRTPSAASEINEIKRSLDAAANKYRTKFKRSLDCNRKFFAYYGSITASFTIAVLCVMLSILMRLFLVLYQFFCWGLEESSAQFPMSSDEAIHVVVMGPHLSGDTKRYTDRLSKLHGIRQMTEGDIVYQKAGKRCFHRSVLRGHKGDEEGWVLDVNAMPSVPDSHLLRYATHLIWIDHSYFVVFARLCLLLFSECLFGDKRWTKAFGVWDRDCDLVLQFQSIEATRRKQAVLRKYMAHCDVEKCKLFVIADIADENTLLQL